MLRYPITSNTISSTNKLFSILNQDKQAIVERKKKKETTTTF